MAEVITDKRMRDFVHSKINNDFGLSIDQVANKCKTYGRFKSWLGSDVTRIKEVLNAVKANGVSPVFFASYEKTEGYNSSWGWLNHTKPAGNPVVDAKSVSNWIVTQSKNTADTPAWIDYDNYKDFVPASVKTAGNEHFKNMKSGSIGKVVIAGTSASTWEVYYPNGLKKEYNGIQNYAPPLKGMLDTIEAWGGKIIDGGGTTPPDPTDPPTSSIKKEVIGIVKAGELKIKTTSTIDTTGVKEKILTGLNDIYNAPLYFNSQNFYSNTLFKLTKTYKNIMKINPNSGLKDLINSIIDEAIKLIKIKSNNNVTEVFNEMIDKINALDDGGTTPPDPTDPPTDNKMFFPVNPTDQGINFWTPPDQPDMDYGGYRTGRLHWAYDIGTLGNANVSCHAVRSGEVLSVNADNLGTVIIKHTSDNYYTQYMHLKLGAHTVKKGDKVTAGQKIGILGGTGGYAIHLHFAVSKNGTFSTEADTINPRPYLKVTGNNKTSLPSPK